LSGRHAVVAYDDMFTETIHLLCDKGTDAFLPIWHS
jgi:hypothetical protein